MKILIITQMFSQPDDEGENKPTKTVNYFASEWATMGNNVVVMHCPSKFPLILYMLPKALKELFARRISTMVPSVHSRRSLKREENGYLVFRKPMLKIAPGHGYSHYAMVKQAKRIVKCLNEVDFIPNLIVGHFANPSLELVALLTNHYHVPSSIVFHQDCNNVTIRKYRINELISRVGAIGCRSLYESNQVKRLLELETNPFVCCSGVPNNAVANATAVCDKHSFDDGIRYIYVGSLIKRKHLDSVINAFSQVCEPLDTLLVVGDGPEKSELQQLVRTKGLENQILFEGRVPREQVLQKMKEAQVFTLISEGEAYGMVYIEAMLQGCITIASARGGFDGIIHDGENGFICEPGSVEQLTDIYRRIKAVSENERNQIGQKAIDTAMHYSEREVAERYLNDILDNQK